MCTTPTHPCVRLHPCVCPQTILPIILHDLHSLYFSTPKTLAFKNNYFYSKIHHRRQMSHSCINAKHHSLLKTTNLMILKFGNVARFVWSGRSIRRDFETFSVFVGVRAGHFFIFLTCWLLQVSSRLNKYVIVVQDLLHCILSGDDRCPYWKEQQTDRQVVRRSLTEFKTYSGDRWFFGAGPRIYQPITRFEILFICILFFLTIAKTFGSTWTNPGESASD